MTSYLLHIGVYGLLPREASHYMLRRYSFFDKFQVLNWENWV